MREIRGHDETHCSLCGRPGPFAPLYPGASLRETRCPGCRSSRRTRDLVRVLLEAFLGAPDDVLERRLHHLRSLNVYELQARGPLHERLAALPGYCCSEYYPSLPSGAVHPSGVMCQDASRLSFPDASFDLVISQDVLEHMADPFVGAAEICRVLRPRGRHLFTVPVHEGRRTRQRARAAPDGTVEHMLQPVHHRDPLNSAGALVYWDFGDDLPRLFGQRGIGTRCALRTAFYGLNDLCRVESEEEYRAYLAAGESPAGFFIYNSLVFECSV